MLQCSQMPDLTLRPPIPHEVTESQSNSGCKVSQDMSGPTSCSQQGQFEVRLSCPGIHTAGSWKVPRTETSGALSGFRPVCVSLLQIFTACGFRGVVMCKGDWAHKKIFEDAGYEVLSMSCSKQCPFSSCLTYVYPKLFLDYHQDFWGSLSPIKLDLDIQVLNAVLQIRWGPSIPTLKSIALAKYTFCVFCHYVFQRLQGTSLFFSLTFSN